jgi:hypothetical protein
MTLSKFRFPQVKYDAARNQRNFECLRIAYGQAHSRVPRNIDAISRGECEACEEGRRPWGVRSRLPSPASGRAGSGYSFEDSTIGGVSPIG